MERLPSYLEHISPPRQFRRHWKPRMSGWVKLHGFIRDEDVDLTNMSVFFGRLMVMELEDDYPRYGILRRLKGSFDERRKWEEEQELLALVTHV